MNRLRELHEAATPGPWVSAHQSGDRPGAIWRSVPGPAPNLAETISHADAALIVALRNNAEAICDLIDAAKEVTDPMVQGAGGDRWWAAHDRLSAALATLRSATEDER